MLVRSTVLSLSLGVALLVTATAFAGETPAPPAGLVLDAAPPIAVAADEGRLAWLRPTAPGRRALVVREPGGTPRVVGVRLPAGTDQLALGEDAGGRTTVVVSAPDTTKRGKRNSLWAVAVDAGRLRKLPASRTVSEGMTAPGLRDGVVSFVARGAGDLDGYAERRLMTARLTSARVRQVASLGSGYAGAEQQTVPAARGRVLVTQIIESPSAVETVRLRVFGGRDRGRSLTVSRAVTGTGRFGDDTGASGLGPVVIDAAGRTVTVSRWAAPTSASTGERVRAPRDLVTASVLGGSPVRRAAPAGADVALTLGTEGFAVFHADRSQYNTTPRPARNASGALRLAPAG